MTACQTGRGFFMPIAPLRPTPPRRITALLFVDRVTKCFGDRIVINDVSFTMDDRDKVALIGPNGCGKTTLLRIVAGADEADHGAVGGDGVGEGARFLAQGAVELAGNSVAACMPRLGELWRLGRGFDASSPVSPEAAVDALEVFERLGGWQVYADVEETLRGLGIDYLDPLQPIDHLSGGEWTKLGLADLLNQSGSLLILDEPTNHLDLDALAWLEDFLVRYKGALLFASHDRALIDSVAAAVIEIDPETHRARRFSGGYTAYTETKERERTSQAEAYRRQQEETDRIEEDIRRVKQRAARFDSASQNDHWRRIGKKVARTAKVRERRLEKKLESKERVEKPRQAWTLKADLVEADRSGDVVAEARGLHLAFGTRVLFDGLSLLVRYGDKIVLTGANGSGKTTLLRLLLGHVLPDAGLARLGSAVVPGYLSQQQESIDLDRTPLEEIRACVAVDETTARTYLHRFLFKGDEVFTRNRSLSYGQRARLSLARLIVGGVNLLVLDEPMNHLDIPSRERFEEALADFHGTVIAVSHDRYFVRRFAGRLLVLEGGRLHEAEPVAV